MSEQNNQGRDKLQPFFSDQEEYDATMYDISLRTKEYQFGFLQGKGGIFPVFIIDDECFPEGTLQDIATWDYQCKGIGQHIVFDMSFTNDRTLEKKQVALIVCPIELNCDKQLLELITSFAGTCDEKTQRANLMIVGKKYKEFLTNGKFDPNYDRCGGHLGELDIAPLVLTLITRQLSFPNQWAMSKHCMYCKKHMIDKYGNKIK